MKMDTNCHTINEQLIENLIQNKVYSDLKSTRDQIEYIVKTIRPLNEFRGEIFKNANKSVAKHRKCGFKSKQFRISGKMFFRIKDYNTALDLFVDAVLSAPIPIGADEDSNELGLSFAAKSLAEFELKDYESALLSADNSLMFFQTNEMISQRLQCLIHLERHSESLELVNQLIKKSEDNLLSNVNETILNLYSIRDSIVQKMSVQTIEKIESQSKIDRILKCVKPPHQLLHNLWVHPNCQLKSCERKGRHYVAKDFIPRNTILLVEKQTISYLDEISQKTNCLNCGKWVGTQIWPCVGCDDSVFCNEQCFTEAYNQFHKYECGLTELFQRFEEHMFDFSYRLISRVGLQKALQFKDNTEFDWNSYLEFKKQENNRSVTDSTDSTEGNRTQLKYETEFKAFQTLVDHSSHYGQTTNICQQLLAIETALIFEYNKQINFDIEDNFELFLSSADLLLKSSRRLKNNCFEWNECIESNPSEIRTVGTVICQVSSFFNHSCDPNINWEFKQTKAVFTTNQDINAGEELSISYGPNSKDNLLFERQSELKGCYFFNCDCLVCVDQLKHTLSIKCADNQCSGPVLYSVPFDRDCIDTDYCCLDCGKVFPNAKLVMKEIVKSFSAFNRMLENLRDGRCIKSSMKSAKQSIETLFDLVFTKSQLLFDCIRELVPLLIDLGEVIEAKTYRKYFPIGEQIDDFDQNINDLLEKTIKSARKYEKRRLSQLKRSKRKGEKKKKTN